MQIIKTGLTLLLAICSMTVCSGQKIPKSILKDFKSLIGSWEGSLTYLDYTSGKPYTMAANMEIKRMGNKFAFSNIYPKEQSANSIDTITVSNDGRFIDKELVKTKKLLRNGDIKIVTEEKGKDGNDNKPATFRHTYMIGKTHYSKRKDVQIEGETNWIKRHEYSYTRKPSR